MPTFSRLLLMVALAACKSPTPPEDDADGDGFTEPADCDDSNPKIKPGALDVWNDDVDANCDEEDRVTNDYLDFPMSLRWGDMGSARPGSTLTCDLNGDGNDDLIVVENRITESRIFGFQSPISPGSLSVVQADVTIDLAFPIDGVSCTDFDGDGTDDVLVGETRNPEGLTPASTYIFYQPAGGFTSHTDDDAVELEYDQNLVIFPIDLTGNGRQELMLLGFEVQEMLPGGTYTSGLLLDNTVHVEIPEFSSLSALDDLDGDGSGELLHCNDDVCSIYDGIIQGSPASLLASVNLPATADMSGPGVSGDFDGDGSADDLVMSSLALGVGLSIDAGTALTGGTPVPQPQFIATHRGVNFVQNAGDVDGDGADDLLMWIDGTDGDDQRLFSGAAMAAGERKAGATLLRVSRANTVPGGMAAGDLDGDGDQDVVFVGASNNEGFMGGYFSSEAL